MKRMIKSAVAAVALAFTSAGAMAAGELNIFNWGDYTSMEMIKKFEEKYDVKVTITDYDSNDTALAKVRAGGHGFDIAVPSANFVPIWVEEGLLLETNPNQMENYKNVSEKWRNVPYDPGHKYSVPWLWGTTGVAANSKVYGGDLNTSKIVFDPPAELEGKILVVPEMNDVMALAIMYHGGEMCTGDKTLLKQVRDTLLSAKAKWLALEYNSVEKFAKGDYSGSLEWNGGVYRTRLQNADIKYGYPKEGFVLWMDNVVVLKDAQNVENAKLFQNFMMTPEAAGLNSTFARYANGIDGSEAFMPDDMKTANEIVIPKELEDKGKFILACAPDVTELYTSIWTDVMK
jgi:spermidine/putrescine transport system substrate-binding protein